MTYVIGTAGHVDHGKSTLVEALTGIDPDRLAEEKEREMTIDLGFAWLTLPQSGPVGIVDVPGHRDFIENMLAGVGGIDLALLIVAADEGVMPQTREHLAILDLLEIPGGVVALTKTDMVDDAEWLELMTLDVDDLLRGTSLENAPIVPVSARSGEGLEDLLATLDAALADHAPRADRGRPRLPVDRVFTISGFGTVVTGTLTDGTLFVGDEVEIVPRHRVARIRGLQSHKTSVESALPGSRVAVNLTGVDKNELQRGDVLAAPGIIQGTTLIDVAFRQLAGIGRPLKHNAEVKFFSGAAETSAYVRLVGVRELPPGAEGWLQLRLEDPIAVDKGDRFILRYPSPPQTIGGGKVLDAHPPHRWRRYKSEVIQRFETLAAGSPDAILLQVLEGKTALTLSQAADAAGLSYDAAAESAALLIDRQEALYVTNSLLMARAVWARKMAQMAEEIGAFHARHPLRVGIPREQLRSRLGVNGKVFNALAAMGVEEELLIDAGTVVMLPDHTVEFSARQQATINELFGLIARKPAATPNVKDAVAMVGDEVFLALQEQGRLIQVSADVFFDMDTYAHLVQQVEGYIQKQGAISVAQARDLFGTSRKYVLALLEHLDNTGVTKRVGDERQLRRPPAGGATAD